MSDAQAAAWSGRGRNIVDAVKKARTIALAWAATAPAALAGDHVANWTWVVTTDDNDQFVEPGETARITLTVDLSVDPPNPGITGQPICGWASAELDVILATGAGHIVGWDILEHYDWLTGDLTTTDGFSLYCVTALNFRQLFDQCEPCPIIEFEWQPIAFDGRQAQYVTDTLMIGVIEGGNHCHAYPDGDYVEWPVDEALITLDVACAADVNNDGALDILDFVAFQLLWKAADPIADCNADADFTILDFVCFQQLFIQGCP
jgi:hypothetical protein